jgi:hypothetical protein
VFTWPENLRRAIGEGCCRGCVAGLLPGGIGQYLYLVNFVPAEQARIQCARGLLHGMADRQQPAAHRRPGPPSLSAPSLPHGAITLILLSGRQGCDSLRVLGGQQASSLGDRGDSITVRTHYAPARNFFMHDHRLAPQVGSRGPRPDRPVKITNPPQLTWPFQHIKRILDDNQPFVTPEKVGIRTAADAFTRGQEPVDIEDDPLADSGKRDSVKVVLPARVAEVIHPPRLSCPTTGSRVPEPALAGVMTVPC